MIAATYAYGDTNLSAAPALAKGDDLCLSLPSLVPHPVGVPRERRTGHGHPQRNVLRVRYCNRSA